jgi:tetratricopeptide (TPR) repeat protein
MLRELDWVVMKCLEKSRDRRYETANALARDVQRYLADEPVEARPPSAGYRASKFVRRHKGPVIAAGLVTLALVGGVIGTTYGLIRARQAAEAERMARLDAQKAAEAERLAKLDAESRRAEAEKQKARAETREQQAIDAVKRFRDAVADNPMLKNSPELEDLRKTLLKEPLAFFKTLREQLQADNDTRPESLARLAAAAFDLGKLTDEIGDKLDAQRAHQEALAIGERLARENPSVIPFQRNLAASHSALGILQSATGRPDDALASLARALEIRERLARESPAETELQRDLASSHTALGLLQSQSGRTYDALASYSRALGIQERLARENPAVTELQRDLALGHNNLAVLQSQTGWIDAALHSSSRALEIRERLARENPAVTEFQHDLAISYNNHGLLQSQSGRTDDALASYFRALRIRERLARENPAVTEFQHDLAATHNNLGILQSEAGRSDDALASYAHALEIRKRLAREHPESPDPSSSLGATLNNMARIDLDTQRWSHARTKLKQAITWQRKALATNPNHPTYRQFLTNHLTNLIQAANALGNDAEAAEAQRELAELAARDPAKGTLDARLKAVIGGERPKDNPERLALAQRADDTQRYALAARLWDEALENDPTLADDRPRQHRYNAACAAALAAASSPLPPGEGQREGSEPPPTDVERAAFRNQALAWLRAELDAWTNIVDRDEPPGRPFIMQTLDHWTQDADLVNVRGEAIDALPESERDGWRTLWADVARVRERAGETPK